MGRAISTIEIVRSDLLSVSPARFSWALAGGLVQEVLRRGKNVVLRTGPSEAIRKEACILVVNLGMSGRLLHRSADDRSPGPSHPGVRLTLDDRSVLVYHDIRRFGRLSPMTPSEYAAWSRALGPEPLSSSFTRVRLIRALSQSRSPVRSWLLDQRRVAGIGNIYANEALFRAGLHPRRIANELTTAEGRRLHGALRRVLRAAIAARGTTLRDYRTAQGWEGSYADELRVYGRQGSPCQACGSAIERLTFGGRSAFFCPTCQPLPG